MTRHSLIPEAHLLLFKEGNVLLLCRQNTGYEDGNYSVIAGHVEANETASEAMVREASEEAGLKIEKRNLQLCHIVHRKAKDERISFFFTTSVWAGEPTNLEPQKCSELSWFPLNNLPENMVPYVRQALENVQRGELYSELGWAQQGVPAERARAARSAGG